MSIAVVIVNFNVCDLLRRCLRSLPSDIETVVVDNGSTDASCAMVRAEFPHVRLLALQDNRGFGVANNLGVAATKADTVLLLNPDTELPSDALLSMDEALTQLPCAGAIGFRQVDQRGAWQLTVGPPPSLVLELVRKFVQGRLDRGDQRLARWCDRGLGTKPRPVPWVAGSCVLVRREAFEKIGGFDEKFFLFFEDIDLCLRLRSAGHAVFYDPRLTVLHHRGQSAARQPGPAERAYRESQRYYWRKHRGVAVAHLITFYQRHLMGSPRSS